MTRARALTLCPAPGCPELTTGGRCPQHARPAWTGSTRRTTIATSGWEQQVASLTTQRVTTL